MIKTREIILYNARKKYIAVYLYPLIVALPHLSFRVPAGMPLTIYETRYGFLYCFGKAVEYG